MLDKMKESRNFASPTSTSTPAPTPPRESEPQTKGEAKADEVQRQRAETLERIARIDARDACRAKV
jgi:hypothetical protein